MVSHDEIKNDTLGMINRTKEILEVIYDEFRKHDLSSVGKVEEVEEKLLRDSECLLKSLQGENVEECSLACPQDSPGIFCRVEVRMAKSISRDYKIDASHIYPF